MILRLALLVVGLAQRAICGNEGSLFVQTSPTVALEWDSVTQEGPILHLNELSTSYFSTFTHPSYPNHAMRIKETKGFCDPTVKSYTGFIDIEHGRKHLFFYFFESRNRPDEDDLILWINGGPGGSSTHGMLAELGPCMVDPSQPNGTAWNQWGWNRAANLLFLDQPIDVGFSYGDHVPLPTTSPEAARDVHAFLTIWFESFKNFKGRPFHFAGESYGGRYIPVFASHIWDRNQVAEKEGRTPINLKSIMIGNGWTNPGMLFGSYYDMLCKNMTITPFLPIDTCSELVYTAPECEKRIAKNCGRHYNKYDCRSAFAYCEQELIIRFVEFGRNWYDISKNCPRDEIAGLGCYLQIKWIEDYLSKNKTKDLLGVPRDHKFNLFSLPINKAFISAGDMSEHSEPYIVGLLERGIRVLIYVGTNDLASNFVGVYRMVQALDWSGGDDFAALKLRNWVVNGHLAGEMKNYGRLTFATIRGAGHLVPLDKPQESAYLVEQWVAEKEL